MADHDDNFQNANEKKKFASSEDRTKDKYSGESFTVKGDPRFAGGMIREGRKCTDILCLGIFIAFLVAMGYGTMFGYHNGNIRKLTAPVSGSVFNKGENKLCGVDYPDYPNLYLRNLLAGGLKPNPKSMFDAAICVKHCPKYSTSKDFKAQTDAECMINGKAATGKACIPDSSTSLSGEQTAPYNTTEVGPFCIPVTIPPKAKAVVAEAKKELMSGKAGKTINDFVNAKDAMLISFAMGFVYSLIFLYLMSLWAEQIAWLCVFLIQVGLLGAAAGSFFEYSHLKGVAKHQKGAELEETKKEQGAAFAGAVVMGFLGLCFLCCVVCGKKHLQLAIDVIDASADFTVENKRVIFVPIVYFFVSLIFLVIWIGAMAYVASLNKIEVADQIIPQNKTITWTKQTTYLGLFMLFGILWILAFIDYTSKFIVMASAATYYFNSGPGKEDGSAELGYAIKIAHMNHAGSIAFGSFIIALVRFIEIVFMYFAKKAEQAGGDNPAIKAIVCIGECILKCIEKVVDYINEAAFAYIAVTGDNFCMGAWNGFLLNVKHCLQFTFANLIAKVFILLGKLAITVGNCFSLLFIMKHITHTTVASIWGPVITVAIVSFFTASLFLGIFETAVMALMTCLAVDMDLHDETPKFGPKTFHDKLSNLDGSAKDSKVADHEGTQMV